MILKIYTVKEDTELSCVGTNDSIDIKGGDLLHILHEPDKLNGWIWVFKYQGLVCWSHNYSIEDKIERA